MSRHSSEAGCSFTSIVAASPEGTISNDLSSWLPFPENLQQQRFMTLLFHDMISFGGFEAAC